MDKRTLRHMQSGQGLAEYALIIFIVAISAILILSLLGIAVQRVYGIVSASFGGKAQATGKEIINITGADCYVVLIGSFYGGLGAPKPGPYTATGHTGYFLKVDTNVPLDQLNTAGTERDLMMDVFADETTIVAPPGISHITFEKDMGPVPDSSLCPRASVVQSRKGAIAVAPVNVLVIP